LEKVQARIDTTETVIRQMFTQGPRSTVQCFSDLTPRSEHSLNVLGENIELEIHRIAHLDLV
jgi:hypothetical protein